VDTEQRGENLHALSPGDLARRGRWVRDVVREWEVFPRRSVIPSCKCLWREVYKRITFVYWTSVQHGGMVRLMNDESLVLGAMLRLARRGCEATVDELYERVGSDRARIRSALGRLDRAGLVERRNSGARLTLAGLAVGVGLRPIHAGVTRRRLGRRAA
jgi:Sugar-specific transcriptional regulator TrmB